MFLFVVLLCCVFQPILHYYCVFGKRESLQRFVVEDGAKPAIFGSYSYDPVRQVFVPPPPDPNAVNGTDKGLLGYITDPTTEPPTEPQEGPQEDPQDPQEDPQPDLQAHLPTGTHSDVHGKTLPHQLTSTPSVMIPEQSLKDSFISTAGWTRSNREKLIYRKKVGAINNSPWWEQPKTTFNNVTFNFMV